MSSVTHSPIPLDSKLGAGFLGNLVAGIFYGITCVQSYIYFRRSDKDRQWFRGLILTLWILDTLHLILITHGLYYYLVSNFGNLAALASLPWSLLAQVYITCISDLCVRCIFGRRVWLMTRRNHLIAAAIALTSTLTFVSGLIFVTRAYIAGRQFSYLVHISYLLYMSLGSGVVADTFIAASLCVNLWRRRTGFQRTDTLVRTLILYSINACLLTAICSVACFVTYAVWPNEFTFIGIYFSLSKLFFNSLLATLNNREVLSERIGRLSGLSMSNTVATELSTKGSSNQGRHAPVVVSINREVVEDIELGNMSPQKVSANVFDGHPSTD